MSEGRPWDGPDEDVAEQRAEVDPDEREAREQNERNGSRWEVDPADAAEQDQEVPIDDDEWR